MRALEWVFVCAAVTFFASARHTRRHSSGHFSRLGHDFSKATKDAGNVSELLVQTGTTAILRCNIDVSPDVPIYWIKQAPNNPIITVDNSVVITDRRFRISDEDSSLHILLTKPEDAGLYMCKTGGDEAKSKKHYVNLTLQEAHAEILGGSEIEVKQGTPLRLSCLLHNLLEEPSYIFWYHGDRVVNFDLTGGAAVRHGRKGSELMIPSAHPDDEGMYVCSPSNARQVNVTVRVIKPKRERYAARQHNASSKLLIRYTRMVYILWPLLLFR